MPKATTKQPRGLWSQLTPEQQAKALAYRGEENHGDPAFLKSPPPATPAQLAACRSMGTGQCAAICLENLPPYGPSGCPNANRVWTQEAIVTEAKRHPNGPLKDLADTATPEHKRLLG